MLKVEKETRGKQTQISLNHFLAAMEIPDKAVRGWKNPGRLDVIYEQKRLLNK